MRAHRAASARTDASAASATALRRFPDRSSSRRASTAARTPFASVVASSSRSFSRCRCDKIGSTMPAGCGVGGGRARSISVRRPREEKSGGERDRARRDRRPESVVRSAEEGERRSRRSAANAHRSCRSAPRRRRPRSSSCARATRDGRVMTPLRAILKRACSLVSTDRFQRPSRESPSVTDAASARRASLDNARGTCLPSRSLCPPARPSRARRSPFAARALVRRLSPRASFSVPARRPSIPRGDGRDVDASRARVCFRARPGRARAGRRATREPPSQRASRGRDGVSRTRARRRR